MTLNLQNLKETKGKLLGCNTEIFRDSGCSYRSFVRELKIESFRHLSNLTIPFHHPVTVIAGTNKIGKTSILLLLACSHEKFMKIDSTSPTPKLREHIWRDVISFTSHETIDSDYIYEMTWRVGLQTHQCLGKRLATSAAWSGLGKKSSDTRRINAKIRNREVRLVDLERVLPGRSFSNALYRKANSAVAVQLDEEINQAFAYVFGLGSVEISEAGGHINKNCFLINASGSSYSTYNAASGEESVIYLLKDLIESPPDSLILIDEVEAGFHPAVQRRLADVIQCISWRDKKQFVITTHSPTLLSSFPAESRRFIEKNCDGYRVVSAISHQAARSKMDSVGHPLVHLYCEDDLAAFLIKQILVTMAADDPHKPRLVQVVMSGPANEVNIDYIRHKRNYYQIRNKIGYCAVLDGDKKDEAAFSHYYNNPAEQVLFLYPHEAPEKFLVQAYLNEHPNAELESALRHENHHALLQKMVDCGLATDQADARGKCYASFQGSSEFRIHKDQLTAFLSNVLEMFSSMPD